MSSPGIDRKKKRCEKRIPMRTKTRRRCFMPESFLERCPQWTCGPSHAPLMTELSAGRRSLPASKIDKSQGRQNPFTSFRPAIKIYLYESAMSRRPDLDTQICPVPSTCVQVTPDYVAGTCLVFCSTRLQLPLSPFPADSDPSIPYLPVPWLPPLIATSPGFHNETERNGRVQ